MEDQITQQLAAFLVKDVIKQPKRQLGEKEALITSGLIDSMSLVDVALFVEKQYGVRIDDTELNAETFDTLEQLAALIRQRKA